ncbi:hypothetical protein RB598_002992 [Gaeumannomyces tritici]
MTQQPNCGYAGCKSPAVDTLPVCRMHYDDLLKKRAGKGAPPSVPTVKERRPPSPPARKPAPFHPATTRLPPETDPVPAIVKNVMRKTAPGGRGTGSKVSPSVHCQSAPSLVPPVDSFAQQGGPGRKKRRLDDQLEGDQAAKISRDARQHISGPPNPRAREGTGPARPVHTSSHTLSSQSFYGSRPTATGASNTSARAVSVEARTFAAGRKATTTTAAAAAPPPPAPPPAASTAVPLPQIPPKSAPPPAPPPAASTAVPLPQIPPKSAPPPAPAASVAPAAAPTATQPTARAAPKRMAEAPVQAPVHDHNAGLKEWFSRALTKDLIGNSRATTTPVDTSTASGTLPQPMVLSMPFVPKAPDISKGEKQAQRDQRSRLAQASPPAEDRHRVFTATKQDLSALDAFVYGQETAQLPPPRGVVLSPKPEPPKPRDEPFFAHLDPRVHWSRPHSEAWYEAKQKEISERPDRKATFGRAAQRMAERRRAERSQAAKSSSSTSLGTASRSRQGSKSSRDAPPDKGTKGGVNAAALARLRKSFDAWDQVIWEKDKEATRQEGLKDHPRKGREKQKLNGTGHTSKR